MASFQQGSTFATFGEFVAALEVFSASTSSLFVKKSSSKIKDPSLAHLAYENVRYVCKQGKAYCASESSGARPNQKSFKTGCTASFRVICIRPKNGAAHLLISKADFVHIGHEVSAHMYSLYPENRRVQLTSDVEMITKTSLRASEVKSLIEQTQGVRMFSQDVKNLRLRLKGASSDPVIVDDILKNIKDNGGHVSFSRQSDDTLNYLCFSTKEMLEMLQRFPHVLLLDFTYKTNKYLMPLLTVMTIDSYGHGFPIMHAFVRNEDSVHLQSILLFLTGLYDATKTNCFVIDKDFSEINAIGHIYPHSQINLCHFHILQAVSRHLKRLGTEMANKVSQIFMRQVTTESETEYDLIKLQLLELLPESSVDYFTHNWWNKPERWATCQNVATMKLHANTTNHLESFHSKIKQTLRLQMGLGDNLNFLVQYVRDLHVKFLDCSVMDLNVRRYNTKNPDAEAIFSSGVSNFVAENVLRELDLGKRVAYQATQQHDNTYAISYKDSSKVVSPVACSCHFHLSMKLPCRHIFFLRAHLDMPSFDRSLIHQMYFLGPEVTHPPSGRLTSTMADLNPGNSSTQEGRYRMASKLSNELAMYLSVIGEQEFLDKFRYLGSLLSSWKSLIGAGSVSESDRRTDRVSDGDGNIFIVPSDISENPSEAQEHPVNIPSPVDSPDRPVNTSPSVSVLAESFQPSAAVTNALIHTSPSPHNPSEGGAASTSDFVNIPSPADSPDRLVNTSPSVSVLAESFQPSAAVTNALIHTSPSPHNPSEGGAASTSDFVNIPSPADSPDRLVNTSPSVSVLAESFQPSAAVTNALIHTSPSPHNPSEGEGAASTAFSQVKLLGCKVKGRPKKQLFTRKRPCKVPQAYLNLSVANQKKVVLAALVKEEYVVHERMIVEERMLRERFLDSVLDDVVSLDVTVSNFSTNDLYDKVCNLVQDMRVAQIFRCGSCSIIDDATEKMIQCEHCLVWFHFSCVGYKSAMNVRKWFCELCWV